MDETFSHDPVMLTEVIEAFDSVPGGVVLDATLGGGGHSAALLERRPDLAIVGIDRDPSALRAAAARLVAFGDRAGIVRARFDDLGEIVDDHGGALSGALFDLGVSSHQIDRADRGFSFRLDGPLDMRMDPEHGAPASDLVNGATEDEFTELFAANGEDRLARRYARAIIAARPIATTTALASVIEDATPGALRRRGHPARRVFQALRVAVNEELEQLTPALEAAIDRLVPGGRVVVLAYHSGEDRLVKALFDERVSGGCTCPPGLPCVCGASSDFRVLSRGARLASAEEIARNPRAEAARLRVLERHLEDS
jgi:16S rRNA (cytosine1402-N4)-methyltransferase